MEQLQKSMEPYNGFTFISGFPKLYSKDESKVLRISRNQEEELLFREVHENIKKDLEEFGIKANYSISILINELAWNLILFSRIKHYLQIKEVMHYDPIYKLGEIQKTQEYTKKTDSKFYEAVDNREIIHPIYNGFLFRLEKSINKLLSLLGLLPQQQLERKKVLFVEKLKKRLISIENKDSEYAVEAISKGVS